MKALLSIKPEFASQIFDGTKKFEYRRSIFKKNVDCIVVYVTLPIGMVLGEFEVEEVLCDDLASLWNKTDKHSGITEEFFYRYFAGKEEGYAIKIGNISRYPMPQDLQEFFGVKPPQSFLYL